MLDNEFKQYFKITISNYLGVIEAFSEEPTKIFLLLHFDDYKLIQVKVLNDFQS